MAYNIDDIRALPDEALEKLAEQVHAVLEERQAPLTQTQIDDLERRIKKSDMGEMTYRPWKEARKELFRIGG